MITIQKWSGLITNASPNSLPGGACVIQNNLQCLKPGQVQCRQGMTTASANLGRVVSMARMAAGTLVVCHSGTAIVATTVT